MRNSSLSCPFVPLFVSMSVCHFIPLELLWELSLLQLFHIKHWTVFFFLFWHSVFPLSVSCSSLGLHHQTSLLALSCFLTWLTLISPFHLCLALSMCMQCCYPVSSSPSMLFSDIIITSALLPLSIFQFFSSPQPYSDLPLSTAYLFNFVRSFLHFHSVFYWKIHCYCTVLYNMLQCQVTERPNKQEGIPKYLCEFCSRTLSL